MPLAQAISVVLANQGIFLACMFPGENTRIMHWLLPAFLIGCVSATPIIPSPLIVPLPPVYTQVRSFPSAFFHNSNYPPSTFLPSTPVLDSAIHLGPMTRWVLMVLESDQQFVEKDAL
jgi:hypothetical protein